MRKFNIVERVARAIAESENIASDGKSRTDVYVEVRSIHRHAARAAIEAMRTPTEAMTFAPNVWIDCKFPRHSLPVQCTDCDDIWRTMIEAALRD